jgi:hypothetical protein
VEREIAGQAPQHADEGGEQNRGLQQADPQVSGQFRQMARILVHALVGIDAHRAGVGEPKSAARHQPALHEVVHQPFAQLQLQCLDQPALPHVEREQRARDYAKHAELSPKLMEILVR